VRRDLVAHSGFPGKFLDESLNRARRYSSRRRSVNEPADKERGRAVEFFSLPDMFFEKKICFFRPENLPHPIGFLRSNNSRAFFRVYVGKIKIGEFRNAHPDFKEHSKNYAPLEFPEISRVDLRKHCDVFIGLDRLI